MDTDSADVGNGQTGTAQFGPQWELILVKYCPASSTTRAGETTVISTSCEEDREIRETQEAVEIRIREAAEKERLPAQYERASPLSCSNAS